MSDDERRIALATLELIEEIAGEQITEAGTEGPWSAVYRLAHYARSAKCRRNHPDWGDPVKARLG